MSHMTYIFISKSNLIIRDAQYIAICIGPVGRHRLTDVYFYLIYALGGGWSCDINSETVQDYGRYLTEDEKQN